MKIKLRIGAFLLGFTSMIFAQDINKDDVLFSVENTPVYAKEFVRVYNKNLDLVHDDSQKDVDTYLELFVDYKLKLQEAKVLGFDKEAKYLREFGSYKKQLAKNYLTDHKVTDALVAEAYERVSNDVKVSHVLIRLNSTESDTASVYNQMLTFKERLENESYDTLRKELHNGESIFVEDLGWFSGFRMIYDFENVAYNTKINEVSMPFRTQFGYHVLKVHDKRKSKGSISVGHIMIANTQKNRSVNPKARIEEIYKMLQEGKEFEALAKQFSEDPSSAANGGKLKAFKSSQLSYVKFEDEAFAIENVGEFSEPFQSDSGWHIVKLYDKKPIGTFDDLKPSLEKQVSRDPRSKVINEAFVETLKKQYGLTNSNENLDYFVSILNQDYYNRTWAIPSDLEKDKVFLNIKDKMFTYQDFALYLQSVQKQVNASEKFNAIVSRFYKEFLSKQLMKFHEDHLEESNEEYAQVLNEYREGLLLFDLMENKVWNAVKNDTIALQNYYEANKNKYQWPERIEAIVISTGDKKAIKEASKLLKKGEDIDTIKDTINANDSQKIIVTNGTFDKDHRSIPNGMKFKMGVSKVYKQNDTFHVIKVNKVLPAALKTFEESRGKVIGDYQAVFESEWLEQLAKKYNVVIDKDVLQKVKAKIKG
ncbi:MAG: peptidylprolyl isomerase [Flavobacteriaceae bacterium]|nr:peptidylprolyl isomerase [Flavobacteriaceae bacterium]